MKLYTKLYLENQNTYLLGPGRMELLRTVGEFGSLRQAAQKMGMSHRWAWGRIKDTEKSLGVELLGHNETSGKSKHLTAQGKELLAWYDTVQEELAQVLTRAQRTRPDFLRKG